MHKRSTKKRRSGNIASTLRNASSRTINIDYKPKSLLEPQNSGASEFQLESENVDISAFKNLKKQPPLLTGNVLGEDLNNNTVNKLIPSIHSNAKDNTDNTSKALKNLRSQSRRASVNMSVASTSQRVSPKTFKFASGLQEGSFLMEIDVRKINLKKINFLDLAGRTDRNWPC